MKTARDTFLNLVSFILLYVLIGTFLSVAFTLINQAFPTTDYVSYYRPSVSFGLATILVITPILLGLLVSIERIARKHSEKIYTRTRKFFTYLTLLFSSLTIIGNFITVVYYLLDGRDFSSAFLLKSGVVILVAASLLWYYITDLAEKSTKTHRMIAGAILVGFVFIEVVASFSVLGTPATARALRYDDQRIQSLSRIQSEVISYWQAKSALPVSLVDLEPRLLGEPLPKDPETGNSYEYIPGVGTSFQLCATFGRASDKSVSDGSYYGGYGTLETSWTHSEGRTCFTRTIDPSYYPPLSKPSGILNN